MELVFRRATRADVPAIVALLANDALGSQREQASDPLPDSYFVAFAEIERDPNQLLTVVELAGEVIGTLHLTYLPSLTYRGGKRALIEAVRVAASQRNQGIGQRMFEWAIAQAREAGCHMVQLTTDKRRPDAVRFYESLGFAASHIGMKLLFNDAQTATAS